MPRITQLTNYTSPQDNDVQPIVDTTNSQTKKISLSSLKSFLKSYFDTLYAPSSHTSSTSAHGVSGNIVGTSDAQTLTSKRIQKRTSSTTSAS
ncbi:MAG: hypothetical protein N3D20_02770, partial [Candidatus Pacearchaeota archaeon]|nr:hypothetical protein [Candidatus Pacearchaeota archaeon]